MDGLARRKAEYPRTDAHALRACAAQVHLDPAAGDVVERLVLERAQVEVRAQLAVEPRQEIEVESRGITLRIVVREVENLHGLLQVHADQHAARPAHQRTSPPQERLCLLWLEVTDRGAGEEHHPARARGQAELRFERASRSRRSRR